MYNSRNRLSPTILTLLLIVTLWQSLATETDAQYHNNNNNGRVSPNNFHNYNPFRSYWQTPRRGYRLPSRQQNARQVIQREEITKIITHDDGDEDFGQRGNDRGFRNPAIRYDDEFDDRLNGGSGPGRGRGHPERGREPFGRDRGNKRNEVVVIEEIDNNIGNNNDRVDNRNINNHGRGNHNRQNSVDQSCKTRDGYAGLCQNVAHCFYQYNSLQQIRENQCNAIVNGHQTRGVCCPVSEHRAANEFVPYLFDPPPWPRLKLDIDQSDVVRAVDITEDRILRFLELEVKYLKLGYIQKINTMAAIHQAVFGPPDKNLQTLNINGFRALEVTRELGQRFKLKPIEMRDGLSQLTLYETPYQRYCQLLPFCNKLSKYRTIDGSCNNLRHPRWGQSNSQFSRILPPVYSDGISEFRLSVSGNPLPLARLVSTELTATSSKTHSQTNVFFVQWGQFLDHDLTLGSSTRASTGQGLLCCNRTHTGMPVFHPACRPIIIPPRDPFYSKFNHRCNNFVRNAVGPKNNCNLGYREQTNVITSFIDASMIYGNEENRSSIVRLFKKGLLKVSQINRREFLPYDTMNNSLACAIPSNMQISGGAQRRCVFAGDTRVNQQIGLTSLQLFFLREHNRLARELKKINWHLSDESLYQEARRIVAAEMQHITYNEFLPLALGRSVMKKHGLLLQPSGHCTAYDSNINPSIINEFAAAAYRWHTIVQGYYQTLDANGRPKNNYDMSRIFNNPSLLYRDGAIDEVTYGMAKQNAQNFDPIFVDDLKNLLFRAPNASFGMDLISINIQRGRDHGIPPYNQIRRACGLRPVQNFGELNGILKPGSAERFARIYDHVDDIDFFPAGVNEIPLDEGILGPTFSCISAQQFRRTRYGDRFWYENGEMKHSFSTNQLNELRKVTLAGIICANGDRISQMQPFAMMTNSEENSNINCNEIPQIDLKHWKNEKIF